jgi:hypothetical protein
MSLSEPFTLLISALSPSEPFQAPQPPTVASRLTKSRPTRGSVPALRMIMESPWLAPATRSDSAGASARATMSISRPRCEKYHWQAAGERAPSTEPSRTCVVIDRNEPPLPGRSGLTSSL